MSNQQLVRSSVERVMETCSLYERRQVGIDVLRVAFEFHGRSLRAVDQDQAARLDQLASEIGAIAARQPEEAQYLHVCELIDRVHRLWSAGSGGLAAPEPPDIDEDPIDVDESFEVDDLGEEDEPTEEVTHPGAPPERGSAGGSDS